jgi:hypothetical protein
MPIWAEKDKMRRLLDADDPFFAAPWRRWATTLVPLVWGLFELWMQDPFWAVLFIGAGAYAGYVLILKGPTDK